MRRHHTQGQPIRTGETAMNELHTHLARAQLAERLEEARELGRGRRILAARPSSRASSRSEEHTSELQSPVPIVCRLLLGKKNTTQCTAQLSSLHHLAS